MKTYFISCPVKKRLPVFLSKKVREICFKSFLNTAKKFKYKLLAFVIMPDHFHLLVGSKDDQGKTVKNFKGSSARAIFLELPELKIDMRSSNFWPKGYHCLLVNIKDLNNFIKYIKNNPLNKKLEKDFYTLFIGLN